MSVFRLVLPKTVIVNSILSKSNSRVGTLSRAKSLPSTAEIPRCARSDVRREGCDMFKVSLTITEMGKFEVKARPSSEIACLRRVFAIVCDLCPDMGGGESPKAGMLQAAFPRQSTSWGRTTLNRGCSRRIVRAIALA